MNVDLLKPTKFYANRNKNIYYIIISFFWVLYKAIVLLGVTEYDRPERAILWRDVVKLMQRWWRWWVMTLASALSVCPVACLMSTMVCSGTKRRQASNKQMHFSGTGTDHITAPLNHVASQFGQKERETRYACALVPLSPAHATSTWVPYTSILKPHVVLLLVC